MQQPIHPTGITAQMTFADLKQHRQTTRIATGDVLNALIELNNMTCFRDFVASLGTEAGQHVWLDQNPNPLMVAVQCNHYEAAETLLKAGCVPYLNKVPLTDDRMRQLFDQFGGVKQIVIGYGQFGMRHPIFESDLRNQITDYQQHLSSLQSNAKILKEQKSTPADPYYVPVCGASVSTRVNHAMAVQYWKNMLLDAEKQLMQFQ